MLTFEELFAEFVSCFSYEASFHYDAMAILILSGDGEEPGETSSRIRCAADVLRRTPKLPVIFSEVTEEQSEALRIMKCVAIPANLAHFQDCGQ